jgi:hypothetical protein
MTSLHTPLTSPGVETRIADCLIRVLDDLVSGQVAAIAAREPDPVLSGRDLP